MGKTLATISLGGMLFFGGISYAQQNDTIRYFKGIVKNEYYSPESLSGSAKYEFTLKTGEEIKLFRACDNFRKIKVVIRPEDSVEVRVVKDFDSTQNVNEGEDNFQVRFKDIISINGKRINKR